MELVLQLLVNGLINGSHYALLGIGFGFIFAPTKITHFAYGPIYAIAAYAAWAAATALALPLALAILIGIAVCALAGVASYLFLYRAFVERGSTPLVILIASLGLFIVVENLIGIVFGTDTKVVPDVPSNVILLGPIVFTSLQSAQVLCLVAVGTALYSFLTFTRYGKAVMAMTDNVEMARIVGIDTTRVSLMAFAIGSAISAVPAILILLKEGATPHMGFAAVFMGFVAMIVGGIGSLRGAVLGGLALGLVENAGMWKIPTEWQSVIAFVALFLVLVFKPTGLFGATARR
jgi:branched-chain amino acid transport system permease protein